RRPVRVRPSRRGAHRPQPEPAPVVRVRTASLPGLAPGPGRAADRAGGAAPAHPRLRRRRRRAGAAPQPGPGRGADAGHVQPREPAGLMPAEALTSAPFRRAVEADNGNRPPTADEWWQESVLFNWSDPRKGLAGQYRLNIHPNRGCATLYTWTQCDGRMLDRR